MDRHPTQLGFIRDKVPQLGECPAMECRALRPASRYPRANVRQIFDGNRPLCAFGLRDNPFREIMVYPGCKAVFLPCELSQTAAAAVGALPLEFVSQAPMSVADVLDSRTRVDLPIAIDGDVCHAHVNAQHAFHVNRFGRLNLADGEQIPFAVDQGQIGFTALRVKQGPLAITAHERYGLPLVQCPDRDFLFGAIEGQNACIVGNRPKRRKDAQSLGVELVGICNLGDAAHGHLRGYIECLAYIGVASL